jgi:hypothetical protein
MALNKDILGQALYNKAKEWNEKTADELGDLEATRLDFWKAIAGEIINHFKTNGTLNIPGTGLISPSGPVTGMSITGTIL